MTEHRAEHSVDLEQYSAEQLTKLIADAEAMRTHKLEGARTAFVQEMRERAAALGLPLEALLHMHAPQRAGTPARVGRPPRRGAGAKVAPKFRGPNGEEWTGRGRMPNWLKAQEAQGRQRKDFAIG